MHLAVVTPPEYERDALFDASSPLNRDNCLSLWHVLRAKLEAEGGSCHTLDVARELGTAPDVVLFQEVPPEPVAPALAGWPSRPAAWVILYECEVIVPRNWDAAAQAQFAKLFTWRDPLVDGERFVKFNFTNRLAVPEPLDLEAAERNLCTVIAGNKHADHPLELYSERRRAIRWFEEHHPEHFDLYGIGWDSGPERYPSYRGRIPSKLEVQGRYWFTICFENARDIPGYITEKLFDCFLARSVPVYRGPDNIAEHVPPETFVDMRDFGSYEELYEYLVSVEPEDYARYLTAARDFLAGGAARPFGDEGCGDVLVGALRALKNGRP
jgi:hypothetical protein